MSARQPYRYIFAPFDPPSDHFLVRKQILFWEFVTARLELKNLLLGEQTPTLSSELIPQAYFDPNTQHS